MSIVIYWLHSFHFFSFSYVFTLYFNMSLHIIDLKFSHIYFIPSRLKYWYKWWEFSDISLFCFHSLSLFPLQCCYITFPFHSYHTEVIFILKFFCSMCFKRIFYFLSPIPTWVPHLFFACFISLYFPLRTIYIFYLISFAHIYALEDFIQILFSKIQYEPWHISHLYQMLLIPHLLLPSLTWVYLQLQTDPAMLTTPQAPAFLLFTAWNPYLVLWEFAWLCVNTPQESERNYAPGANC